MECSMKRTLLISPVKSDNSKGFTLVELLVSIGITAVLGVVIVAYMTASMTQIAVSGVRSKLSSTLQTALIRVNDDVRNSAGVMPYNFTLDPNAPSSGGEWSSSSTVLVLASNATKTDGTSYDSASYNSVVYYVKDNNLYKRLVAYQDPDNQEQTITCGAATALGGCPADTVIVSNLASLEFIYYTKTGTVTTDPMVTASVRTNATLQTSQSGRPVSYSDSATMTPRVLEKFADNAPFTAGLGGVHVMSSATINGGPSTSIYSSGGLRTDNYTSIGTAGAPISRINLANRSCGTNATYGSSCAPSQPIPTSGGAVGYSNIYSNRLCAANQISGTPGSTYNKLGVTGLVAGCSPNFRFQPVFDKAAHAAKMVAPAASSITCVNITPSSCQGPVDIVANKKINGSVTARGDVIVNLRGNTYITGNLLLGDSSPNKTVLVVDAALTKRPVVVVNGRIEFRNFEIQANAGGITPIFVSFYSSDSTGRSLNDNYTTQDPQLIYNTVNLPSTISFDAVTLYGLNAVYDGSFYAYFGRLTTGINTIVNGTIAAQQVEIGSGSQINLTRDPWNDL